MDHLDYLRAAGRLEATEELDPWTALMRVLLSRLRSLDVPPALLPALAQAEHHWTGQAGDLMEAKLAVWSYIHAIQPRGADLTTPEGRVARALLCVLEPAGDDGAQSDTAEWFTAMVDDQVGQAEPVSHRRRRLRWPICRSRTTGSTQDHAGSDTSPHELGAADRPARIRFLTPEEGGRFTAPRTGVRPQLAIGSVHASCMVESVTGADEFPLGKEVAVTLRMMIVDRTSAAFVTLTSIELFEGSKLVATGVFLDAPRAPRPAPGEQPILADLAAVGFEVSSLADLRESGLRYREAIPVLVDWLGRVSVPKVKEEIVRALSVPWATPAATRPLINEFRDLPTAVDPTGSLRWAVGSALNVLYDDTHFEAIADLAVNERYGGARQMLVLALGKSRRPEAVDVLLSLVESPEVDGHAVQALAKLKAPAARAAFDSALDDRRAWVRTQARNGLERLSSDHLGSIDPSNTRSERDEE